VQILSLEAGLSKEMDGVAKESPAELGFLFPLDWTNNPASLYVAAAERKATEREGEHLISAFPLTLCKRPFCLFLGLARALTHPK